MTWVDLAVRPDGNAFAGGAAAHELVDAATSFALRTGLGIAIGSVLARAMRARGVHWSYSLGAVVLAVLAHRQLGSVSLPLGAAGLCAARTGRRWHREDVDDGGDLARSAAERRAPLGALLTAGFRRVSNHRRPTGDGVVLGVDRYGRPIAVPARDGRHVLIVGATGSGKTVTQSVLAASAVAEGSAAIVVDPKGDAHMYDTLLRAAARAQRPFFAWTPAGGAAYNPYARGTDSEVADKVLAGERFTEPHYLRQAQRYVAHVVAALREAGEEVSPRALAANLDPDRLELLVRSLPGDPRETHEYLDSLTPRQRADLAGVRDRLAILAESDVGRWLDPAACAAPRLDLLAAVRSGACVYFNLEADRRPLLSQMLGAAIVQDLLAVSASLQGRPLPALVLIDEFSAVAATQVVRLFGRARSAGLTLVLGTQELSDLRVGGDRQVADQVLGNVSSLVAHRQVVPASAELISQLGGVRGAWRVTRHSAGHTTRTRTQERVLAPEEVTCLAVGRAAVIGLSDGRPAAVVAVRAASPGEVRR
jgi:type IV secretory pathway TraG/TraD family ATPase VirD4